MKTKPKKPNIISELTLLSRTEVANMWGVSTMTVKRKQACGQLKPIYLSTKIVRYKLEDVLKMTEDAAA